MAAQFSELWGAREVQRGQRANLFGAWAGGRSLGGVLIELPPRWQLERALLLRRGYQPEALDVQRRRAGGNQYLALAEGAVEGAAEIVLQVETGGPLGPTHWALVPLTRSDGAGGTRVVARHGLREEFALRQVEPVPALGNRVLAFRGEGPALRLRRAAVPDLGSRAAFTVEFWMRTTDFDEVVLSTWDGREQAAYPLEVVVDAAGRLRFFRGEPGRHASMATPQPVADGQWHHVAITHDAGSGWTRLFLDAAAADSLYSPVLPALAHRTPLAVGARLPARQPAAGAPGSYTGLLDELRLWPFARAADDLRRTMRQPLETAAGAVLLGFEDDLPRTLVEAEARHTERVASDLAFYQPVRDVQAADDGAGVVLTWRSEDPHTRAFVVERSVDGRRFEALGEVAASEALPGERGRFRFRDADVADEVVFYRLRQRFESGAERLSGTIKLGLGTEDDQDVLLTGNFPNPFNPATTITYEVRRTQRVRLSVWDLSGQQVALLVDRVQPPGTYQAPFSGHDLPSGTYFVRLETPTGMQVHKAVLAK